MKNPSKIRGWKKDGPKSLKIEAPSDEEPKGGGRAMTWDQRPRFWGVPSSTFNTTHGKTSHQQ